MAVYSMCKPENFRGLEQNDLDLLNSKTNLPDRICAMTCILQLTKEEIHERKVIISDITRFLRPYYPNSAIIPFGSSVNGFGFKGCDLDLLFLPFPEYCNLDFNECTNVAVPNPSHVREGKYSREQLLTLNESYHLKFIKRIMYSKTNYFKRALYIPAKCPILNIEFVQSDIVCDFSASNRLVLSNTELQLLYGNLDYRVKPLMMLLRYWAKALGFIQKSLLSSYAFSFLVIFYLQNTWPPILPPVKQIIEMAEYSRKIDGWETAVCQKLNAIPANENCATVDELLIGFFEFYWNFNFIHNVVSPHNGRAIHVKELLESNDARIKTFHVTPFSIQDPFILSRNISRNATMKTSFKLALLLANRHLQSKDFSFQNLFEISFYESEMNKMCLHVLQNVHESSVSSTIHLSYEVCCKLGTTNELYPWQEKVCQIVLDLLQYGLLIECEVVDKIVHKKKAKRSRKKRKVNCDNVGKLQLIMSVQCAAYYNTWHARKKTQVMKSTPNAGQDLPLPGVLEIEHNISMNMVQFNSAAKSPHVWFFCNCYAYYSANMTDIVLIFSPVTNVKMFSIMSTFLKSYVPKLVRNILNED